MGHNPRDPEQLRTETPQLMVSGCAATVADPGPAHPPGRGADVLLDVFSNDAELGRRSANALRRCIAEGSPIACDVVWVEIGAWFPDAQAAENALVKLRVEYSPLAAVIGATRRVLQRATTELRPHERQHTVSQATGFQIALRWSSTKRSVAPCA